LVRSNLLQRVLTATILIPIALFIIFKGNEKVLFWIISVICVASYFEYCEMSRFKNYLDKILGSLFVVLLLFVFVFYENYYPMFLTFYFCFYLSYLLFRYGPENFTVSAGQQILAILYFSTLLGFAMKIFFLEKGRVWIFLLLLVNWLTDSFAYFSGTLLGKHHFSQISPKKTIEGLVGGIIGGIISVVFVNTFLLKISQWFEMFILGILGSIFGQIGDLFESGIKRSFGVKDSGTIIPGHGGFMDRFDSLFFTSPLFYFFVKFIFRG